MNLPYADPANPALPSPLFSDITAVRADHLRANNAAIFGNFTAVEAALNQAILPPVLGTIENNAVTPNSKLDFGPGAYWSDDFAVWIADLVGMVKTSGAWAAGDDNGMLDSGSVAASKTYYLFRIWNPTAGTADYLMSLSASAPSMPASFTKKRLIGAIVTDTSAYFLKGIFTRPTPTRFQCRYLDFQVDRPYAASGSLDRVLVSVSAPVNALVLCSVTSHGYIATYSEWLRFGNTTETDVVPGEDTCDLKFHCYGSPIMASANLTALVDTNGQVYFRCASSTFTYVGISTKGWQLSL